jgi:hypothetical protein
MTSLILLSVLGATCAECHKTQAEAFAASRHARAFEVPVFAVSYPRAKTTWCLRCHLPEGRPHSGLTCESCHRVESAEGDHPKLALRVCAACHEFNSPLPPQLEPVTYSDQPLQTTVSESGAKACAGCHDPHAALGSHDLSTLKSALRFEAWQGELTVTASAGHHFPTGDPFRRLEIVSCDDPQCTVVLERQRLAHNFGFRDGKWKLVRDSSLADGASRTLKFTQGRFWRATYCYGDPRLESGLPAEEISVVVGAGTL